MIQKDVYILINDILKKHNIPIELKHYVDLTFGKNTIIWNRPHFNEQPKDKISDYLKENIFQEISTENELYYHYLPNIEYLEKILRDKEIRLNNLNKYLENGDNKEYRLFLESFGIDFLEFEKQTSSIKNDIYVWCLTKKRNSERHWEEYANKGKGVAISVEIINPKFKKGIIEVIPVCYNLDFLKEIQESLYEKYKIKLEIKRYPTFAKYFKDEKKYRWEEEIRVCFDKSMNDIHNLSMDFLKNIEEDRSERLDLFNSNQDDINSINIPLKNSFFEIKIKEIFCNKIQYDRLSKYVKPDEIKFLIRD